jgi:hypothetical protein
MYGIDAGGRAALEVLLAVITGVGQQRIDRAERLGQGVEARQGGADLLLVVGVIGDVLRDDQVRLGVDVGLCVVGLLEAAAGGGHDARLRVGEADLILGPRAGLGRFGRLAAGLPAGALGTGFALGQLAFVLGLLGLEARLRAGFDLGLGRGDDGEALLAALELQRDVQVLRAAVCCRPARPDAAAPRPRP